MEAELVNRAGIPFTSIPAAGLHGVGPRSLPGNSLKLVGGLLASYRILRKFRPDVLFFTGGYLAAPMALAGHSLPTLLYVPDIEPGLALNFLARFADRIAVTAHDSTSYFQNSRRMLVTGYPLRADLASWSRTNATHYFNLLSDMPVILILGGSRGARSINQATLKNLSALLEISQVIHITGSLDWETVSAAAREMPDLLTKRYHPLPYLHEMGAALAAADLVISRAGASVLGEYPAFGLPAILVPYPHAWRYQKTNADYLIQRGAAVILEDERLDENLLNVVNGLIQNPLKLEAMQTAMRALSQPHAAQEIADQLIELADRRR
jgi:UDP-N-acetylglucosamine:LPS N-acetylglucosamine transferase